MKALFGPLRFLGFFAAYLGVVYAIGVSTAPDSALASHSDKSHVARPRVSTGETEQLGKFRVEMIGYIFPKGLYASYWFQWGSTPTYGHVTESTLDEGFEAHGSERVSKVLHGLRANVQYHYRIVAKNRAGKSFGADRTFYARP